MMFIVLMIVAGLFLLRKALNTKTAFNAMMTLVVVMPFLLAFGALSVIGGIVITVFASLAIIWLDEYGILS